LKQLSFASLALAILVDLFTVLLTWWLETVPFGDLAAAEVSPALAAIRQFTVWRLNRNGQFEFEITQTDEERYVHFNDFDRLFWTALLLSLGLIRRVGDEHCEFTPRLYSTFCDPIYLNEGRQHGNSSCPTADNAANAASA
jgi:hypothetical protein